MAMSIRKNDQVIVRAGKDRGKKGRVLSVVPGKNRVVVEGVNLIKRHTRPNPQKNIKGGIVERGRHEALLAQGGRYAQMWALQQAGPDDAAMSVLAATTTTGAATSTSMNTLPSNIKTTAQYKKDQENAILSPADGRIVKVEKVRDPYADRDALLISVFMNVFNVHSNRASVDGQVRSVAYHPGLFVNADLDKASSDNERNAVVIDAQVGGQAHVITLVQVAGLIARRILCYVKPGDMLQKGQRYGFIRFGSRVDVYLPLTAVPQVGPGDVVHATTTVLATL